MPPSNSALAHRDVRELADRALANGRGILVRVDSLGEAKSLASRVYKMRNLDRRENCRIYPDPEHPMHNASAYDALILTPSVQESGQFVLAIEVSTSERLEERIEEL